MARRTVQVRHLCFGWNHPQFAYALAMLASVLGAIGKDGFHAYVAIQCPSV